MEKVISCAANQFGSFQESRNPECPRMKAVAVL